jgi:hypothetical protein
MENKPIYEKCIDYPAAWCHPDSCGKFKICRAVRIAVIIDFIFTYKKLLDYYNCKGGCDV